VNPNCTLLSFLKRQGGGIAGNPLTSGQKSMMKEREGITAGTIFEGAREDVIQA